MPSEYTVNLRVSEGEKSLLYVKNILGNQC